MGSWGWDPAREDSVPGFEEVGRFCVGRFACPSHDRRDAGQTLMRSGVVIPKAEGIKIDLNRVWDSNFSPPGIKSFFQGSENAFDSTVLPGTKRIGGLFADAEQPQRETHQMRDEW